MTHGSAVDDPSMRDAATIATSLEVDPARGLDSQEAALRLARDGPNELRAAPPIPAWRRWLSQFQDPLTYLLLGASAIALVAWVLEGRIGWPIDATVIVWMTEEAQSGGWRVARPRHDISQSSQRTEDRTWRVLQSGALAR